MARLFRIALLVGVVAGCERRTEDVVVAPPPPIQPEQSYSKF